MRRALLVVLLSCAVLAGACKRDAPEPVASCGELDAGAPIDPVLLAFLSRARAAHHAADNRESDGALGNAIVPLAALVAGPYPTAPNAGAGELPPEVREVLADTRARLADLRSRLGAFDEALADVRAGFEQARDPNYFRGHLLETEGLVEERHAKALEKTDPAAAALIRKRAIDLLEQAMSVQSGVIEAAPHASAALADSATPPPPAASAH